MPQTNIRTHKVSGWTRTALGWGNWLITPTDDSGPREVAFLSRGSWANLPNDTRENIDTDRVVLTKGAELPPWAVEWLDTANRKSCESGRKALQAAIDDADWNESRRDGW
jgi:hypothetical protein